jgi:acetate---CoA ligase (ADP-forming)
MEGQNSPPGALHRLLQPRTIAVFGGKAAAAAIRQLRRIGYRGEVWPVHPTHEKVEGLSAYRSVAELPAAPDAAFLGINRELTIEVIAALAARGAGGAVVYASGFSESGARGGDFQERLVAAAGAMRFFGPNCYGFINYLDNVLLWPDQHGGKQVDRGIAIVTQSGNLGLNVTMQRRGLPLAYLITLGNQAVVGVSAMIEALLDDKRVTAIGLHIEGIDGSAGFSRAASRARAQGIPIVVLKTGRTEVGAQLAVTHTASLPGPDALVNAFLNKCGVARVHSLPVLIETLKLLHLHGPLAGRDIASMSCSGGEAALVADAVDGRRLRFRPLTPAEQSRIAQTLPDLVTVSNPLDYHTFIWANEPALTETFAAMIGADFALTMLILDFPRDDCCDAADWQISVNALITAARRVGGRTAVVSTLPETMPEDRARALLAAGVVPLSGVDDALAAIEAAADIGNWNGRHGPFISARSPVAPAAGTTLSEWQSKQMLAAHGLTVPDGRLVATPEAAQMAAAEIGFPVALKAVGTAIAHKSDIGGVKLWLGDGAAVAVAAAQLRGHGDAILVERMVVDGVAELIVGFNHDATFGPYMLVGSGGILTELIGDSRILLMRTTREEIIEAIGTLKVAALLNGYRGSPVGDLNAVVDWVLALQSFAIDHADRLLELDVNPLIVRPEGLGAVAADALIRLAGKTANG